MNIYHINSKCDNLELEIGIIEAKEQVKGIVQISHGMSEHKERYLDFMNYLSNNGYTCVIHDHRGHGKSIKHKEDLGYFYTEDANYIVKDLAQVTNFIQKKYPKLDIILFSHSMGTLVSRNYLKEYDLKIKKIILCGPPTKNNLVDLGILLAKLSIQLGYSKKANYLLNKLTFGTYNKNKTLENEWICSNLDVVKKYNEDELCGYIFTTNGFLNLFYLMKNAYSKDNWQVKNKELNILVIAGKEDPVIQNENKFNELITFLKEVGYSHIQSKLYPNKRHELLNETEPEEIYHDILNFIEK